VWRGLSSDVTAWARGCLAFQWGKIHRHTCLAPPAHPHPAATFSHLHIDLVGLLQYSNSFNYIFTIIDRASKWMEAMLFVICPREESERKKTQESSILKMKLLYAV
jgi:hypothetical protein